MRAEPVDRSASPTPACARCVTGSRCCLFKWRQFEPESFSWRSGWYLRFSLSYRDVEELLGSFDENGNKVR